VFKEKAGRKAELFPTGASQKKRNPNDPQSSPDRALGAGQLNGCLSGPLASWLADWERDG